MNGFNPRRLAALGILAAWAITLGFHVRREYFRPAGEMLALGARSLSPGMHFFTVRMGEATIGSASASLDTVDGGFRLSDALSVDVPALDTVTHASVQTTITLNDSLDLRAFRFRLQSELGEFMVAGKAMMSDMLELEVYAGTSSAERSTIRIPDGAMLDAAVAPRLAAAGRLVPGQSVTVRVFDPSTLSARESEVRVTATDTLIMPDSVGLGSDGRFFAAGWDTIPVWKVEQMFGGIAIATWVDEDGLTVRAETPLGFTIERTAFELARQALHDARRDATLASGYGVLIEGTAIASNINLTDLATRDTLSVRLKGVDLAGFDLAGGRQELRGDTLTIVRESRLVPATAGYSLPYRGSTVDAAELEATPLIQSDDERIRDAAREATEGTRDPVEAAIRLNAWVYRNLHKEITPSLPSAVQVLEKKRGDCNEHTVLYVAMARALGLPARTAVGLAHVRGRFFYHAWPEVWLLNRWVAMDPTFGQTPADAGHLRFLVGGLARQVELIRLVGRLQLEVT
jgi:transglutaminase-like putative cysteine protease